jgi:hypothetical protein
MIRGFALGLMGLALAALAAPPAAWAQSTAPAARTRLAPAKPAAAPVKPLGSFTPSFGETAGIVPRAGASVDARQFRFTPSGGAGDSRAISLGVDTRVLAAPTATRGSDEPAGYEAGMALGIKGVSLTGRVARMDAGLQQRESVAVGLAYGRRDWQTMLRLGAEHQGPPGAAPLLDERNYSVELGGSYNVRRNIAVGANLRYRMPEDPALRERAAQDGAAVVGAKVAF